MKIEVKKTFEKDFSRLPHAVQSQVTDFLITLSRANDLREVTNVKKLVGFKEFYRMRLGEYRIGFRNNGDLIIIDRVLHRKDIYKNYP